MERKKKKPERKQRPVERSSGQEVVYTPAAPLNRKKFLLTLATITAVVLALFISCAIFFRVDKVEVSGASKYSAWTIKEASGIEEGESLLSFGKAAAAGRIMEQLRYVKSVRVGITLPDTVKIYVEELDAVYAVADQQGSLWLVASDGRVVEKATQEQAEEHPRFKGIILDSPVEGEQAKAVLSSDGSDPQRLEAALSVATQLENNEILGKVASVDVTDLRNIQLWYGTQYQVRLGAPEEMERKISMMKAVISRHEKEGGHQSGVLDISLTMYPDSVPYTPF